MIIVFEEKFFSDYFYKFAFFLLDIILQYYYALAIIHVQKDPFALLFERAHSV